MRVYFLISNFHHVLNVVFFLLGDFAMSEFYLPTFGTLCSIFVGGVSRKKEEADCSEMWANEIQTPGSHTKEEYQETVFVLACVCSSHVEQ